MEFDVLAVLPTLESEDLESAAAQLLRGFMHAHAEAGPVASVDLARGTFDIAFTVEASDTYEAIEVAKTVFRDGAAAAAIDVRPLDGFHVDAAVHDRVAVPA